MRKLRALLRLEGTIPAEEASPLATSAIPSQSEFAPDLLPSAEELKTLAEGFDDKQNLLALIVKLELFRGHPERFAQRLMTRPTEGDRFFLGQYIRLNWDVLREAFGNLFFEILQDHPHLIRDTLLIDAGDWWHTTIIWNILTHDDGAFLERLAHTLAPRPDILFEVMGTIFSHIDTFSDRRCIPGVRTLLDTMRGHPQEVHALLLTKQAGDKDKTKSAIKGSFFWEAPIITDLKLVFRDHPEMFRELLLASEYVHKLAKTHHVKGMASLAEDLKEFPGLLHEAVTAPRAEDGNTPIDIAIQRGGINGLFLFLEAAEQIPAFPHHLGAQLLFPYATPHETDGALPELEALKQSLKYDNGQWILPPPKPGSRESIIVLCVLERLHQLMQVFHPGIDDGQAYNTPTLLPWIAEASRKYTGGWQKIYEALLPFSGSDIADLRDMMHEILTYVAVPYFAQNLGEQAKEIDGNTIIEVMDAAMPHLAMALFKNSSIVHILKHSRNWHQRRAAILGEIRDFPEEGEWHALLDEKTAIVTQGPAKGWEIINLTSSNELQYEHEVMGHCINGYSPYCKATSQSAHSDILTIRDQSGNPQFTLELKRVPVADADIVPPGKHSHGL
ncbi:MAG: hypothetical protein J0L97_05910, partial [Alphaproteobacteria bacterium]|nr:hypothetical protein [Alphaproteobacteria bacterium]